MSFHYWRFLWNFVDLVSSLYLVWLFNIGQLLNIFLKHRYLLENTINDCSLSSQMYRNLIILSFSGSSSMFWIFLSESSCSYLKYIARNFHQFRFTHFSLNFALTLNNDSVCHFLYFLRRIDNFAWWNKFIQVHVVKRSCHIISKPH